MTIIRSDLGTPHLVTCPRCQSGDALEHPVVTLSDATVDVSPWVLITCRACGLIAKHRP